MSLLLRGFVVQPGNAPPDFSGFSVTRIFMPVKTSEATKDYCYRIDRNGVGSEKKYVFYDDLNYISLDSQVSTTTTPDEDTTLREYIQNNPATDVYYIDSYYCQISGLSLTFNTLVNSPILVENRTLKYANFVSGIEFNPSATGFLSASAISELGSGQNFTIATVTAPNALATPYVVFNSKTTSGGDNSRFNLLDRGDNGNVVVYRNTTPTDYIGSLGSTLNNLTQKELIASVENAGDMKTFSFGVLEDTDSVTGNFTNDTFQIGAGMSGLFPFDGIYQGLIVCNINLSDLLVADLHTTLDGIFNYNLDLNVVADGNSLTLGTGSTAGNDYPQKLEDTASDRKSTIAVTNKGVGGQTTPNMESDATTDIDTLINGSKTNVLLAWEGRNDLVVNSATVQDAYDNLVEYCQNRRAAGWKVIVFTLLPSWQASYKGDNTVTGYNQCNADRLAVNALIQDNWQTFADEIVDFSTNSDIYTFGNNEQAGYAFSTSTRPTTSANGLYDDGTHLTDSGYNIVALITYNSISKLLMKN